MLPIFFALLCRKLKKIKENKTNKRELSKLRKWTDTLTDEELKEEYYKSMFDCLGSICDEMYERGYTIEDIKEQENMLSVICSERKIKLWENKEEV